MKLIGVLLLIPAMIIVGFLISMLTAHVILDVALLYNVTFLMSITFEAMFGFLGIITLIWTTRSYTLAEKESKGTSNVFGNALGLGIGILLSWGLLYIAHWLFF